MDDKKSSKSELTSEILIADIMLRITAMEKLLLEKNLFTKEELLATTQDIAKSVAKVILEKAQSSKDIDDFIHSLEKVQPPKDDSN